MCRQVNSRKMKQIPEGAYVCKTRNRALEKPLAQTRVALVVLPAPPNIYPIVIRNLGSTFSEIGSGKLTDEALHKKKTVALLGGKRPSFKTPDPNDTTSKDKLTVKKPKK